MLETTDPVAALSAARIPERCAGARDLALVGTPEHLGPLLGLAARDPSSGVRLGAAAAAADILSRHRLPETRGALSTARRQEMLSEIVRTEPGVNPGLFQVAGTLDLPEAQARVFLGLRDPRADVRVGATVGLRRLAASATRNGDTALEALILEALDDPRIRPETRAEIARLCADLGIDAALPAARLLAASGARGVAQVARDAVTALETPPPWDGIWVDLGLDTGEVRQDVEVGDVVATVGDQVVYVGAAARRAPRPSPRRIVRWKRDLKAPPVPVVQLGQRSLFAADADEQALLGDRLVALGAWELAAFCDPVLPATGGTLRLRGALLLHQGDAPAALVALQAAVDARRTPPDAWWWLAEALTRLGRPDEARPHLERFVAKAPKRHPLVAEARARLGGG